MPKVTNHWMWAAPKPKQGSLLHQRAIFKEGCSLEPSATNTANHLGMSAYFFPRRGKEVDLGDMTWCHSSTQPDQLEQSIEIIRIDCDPGPSCYNICWFRHWVSRGSRGCGRSRSRARTQTRTSCWVSAVTVPLTIFMPVPFFRKTELLEAGTVPFSFLYPSVQPGR